MSFPGSSSLVVIRKFYDGFTVCRTGRKSAGDQMRWAIAHLQFWVTTLQVVLRLERHGVRNRRACAHDKVLARTTEDARSRDMALGAR